MRNSSKLMMRPLVVAVLCLLSLFSAPTLLADDIDELVRQLGAPDFQTREKATAELIKAGYTAKKAVRQALRSKDPEVAQRAKRIWEKIKMRVFPGAGEDVALFLAKLSKKRNGSMDPGINPELVQFVDTPDISPKIAITHQSWRVLAKKYGVRFLYLAFFLNDKKEQYGRHIPEACETFLEIYPPEKVMEFSEKAPNKVGKFLDILSSIRAGSFPEDIALRGVKTLLLANRPVDAILFAANTYSGKDGMTSLLNAVKKTAADSNIFSKALEKLKDQGNSAKIDGVPHALFFLTKLAAATRCQKELKQFLDSADIATPSARMAIDIAQELSMMGLSDEALEILTGITTPESIYIRALIYRDMGDDAGNVRSMEALSKMLRPAGKKGLFKLATIMMKYQDHQAYQMLENVIKLPPHNTMIDTEAMLRLGMLCKRHGKYGEAADWYEKTLKNLNGTTLVRNVDGTVKTGDEAIEAMKANIQRLRQIEKGGGESWKAANKAWDEHDYKTALSKLDEFIHLNPDFPKAWRLKAELLHYMRQLNEALKTVDKAIELTRNNKQEQSKALCQKSQILCSLARFDEAFRTVSDALKKDPENLLTLSVHGMSAFYAGQYQPAINSFETVWREGGHDEYNWLWICIASHKLGNRPPDFFSQHVSELHGNEWPIPLLRFYAGDITEQECLEAAAQGTPERRKEKECEAYYYIGEWYLWNGNKDKALEYFKKCVGYGIVDFREHLVSEIRIRELAKGDPAKRAPSPPTDSATGKDSQ